eukprot:TRINITY_DN6137_c2_g2_i2.p1 TRINITY_DN6137_c2_g2~~TRINITY_DN6137_c2_g2_i2.p1  ORF type:complete len:468 (-),score=20.47 TRINITY_DN6137_c2_g2_i2:1666-2901(-)
MQAISSPLGGLLGHYHNRILVISAGCLIWGLMTLAFSTAQSVGWGMVCWGINGIGLAMVIPNYQSLTADYYPEQQRGRAFGTLHMTSYLGGMIGGMFGTNVAHQKVLGQTGWRVAFFCVGVFSLLVSFMNFVFSNDPRDMKKLSIRSQQVSAKKMWGDVKSVVVIPSFVIVILQGIVGFFPWSVLVFLTLYLQLIGMSDFAASFLNSLFLGCCGLGGLLGGFVGDLAALRYPRYGRIAVCQFSVAIGLPLTLVLFNLPMNSNSSTIYLYGMILTMMGLTVTWAATACNNPIFAEIVPEEMRNIVYSFDRSFEQAIASFAPAIVGSLAHRVFDFQGSAEIHPDDPIIDQQNAHALRRAMMFCMIVPWTYCLIVYTGLYWTYPKDKERSKAMNKSHDIELSRLIAERQDQQDD